MSTMNTNREGDAIPGRAAQPKRPLSQVQWAEVDWGRPEPTPQPVWPRELTDLYAMRQLNRINGDELHAALAAEDVATAVAELRVVVAERERAQQRRWGSSRGGYIG